MTDRLQFPPADEAYSYSETVLGFEETGDGVRRLVRIDRMGHAEQRLSVMVKQPGRSIQIRSEMRTADNRIMEGVARITMSADEARIVMARLGEALAALDAEGEAP